MQMDELRCKTPELVRKEVWAHVLAYNLIRTVMAQAAATTRHRAAVDQLQGSHADLGSVSAAAGARDGRRDAAGRLRLYHDLLDAIATHRVADRPDRYEPRVKKRRRNHYDWLTKPRAEIKRKMAKGVTKN